MSLQDYEIFTKYFGSADQRPKNGGCEEGRDCVPVEEWYKPYKHKEKLIEFFHRCMLSGYEIDRTSFFDNYNRSYYYVYTGRVTVKISTDEYGLLWNEAADSFEEWRNNLFRARSKQGPTRDEVMENYIAPLPRNGKLPYVGRGMSRKYGNEKLLQELMEKYKLDGPTEMLSQGTTSMNDRGTFIEEIRNEANRRTKN